MVCEGKVLVCEGDGMLCECEGKVYKGEGMVCVKGMGWLAKVMHGLVCKVY